MSLIIKTREYSHFHDNGQQFMFIYLIEPKQCHICGPLLKAPHSGGVPKLDFEVNGFEFEESCDRAIKYLRDTIKELVPEQ